MEDPSDELIVLGFVVFGWACLFPFLSLVFGWLGFLSTIFWSVMYGLVGVVVGYISSSFFCSLSRNWFLGALGFVIPIMGIAYGVFPQMDPTVNISVHAGMTLLMMVVSRNVFRNKEQKNRQLQISFELEHLLKDYDIDTLDSDLGVMLGQAACDRMDIHEKIYLSKGHDDLLEGLEVLRDVDDALCSLLKQAKTIMQFRERMTRAEKEDLDDSSAVQLQSKLNDQMEHFTNKKAILHELTIDILEIDIEQISLGIESLQKKREEVALVEKTHQELR